MVEVGRAAAGCWLGALWQTADQSTESPPERYVYAVGQISGFHLIEQPTGGV
jgi:hypothetical protein